MAIVDILPLGNLNIIVADADPSVPGNDIDAPQGSLVVLNTGAASFFKTGTGVNAWGTSILGTGSANTISKFTGTGTIGNSTITDTGSLITLSSLTNATGGIYNGSFLASNAGQTTSSISWLGTSANMESAFILNYSTTTTLLGAGSNYIAVPILGRTLTEAASGTHNLFAQLGIQAGVLNLGTATTTNAATVYIEGATTGTAGPTNNYALWVDDGVTRLDGTALINNTNSAGNTVIVPATFQRSTTTTPAVGIGSAIDFSTQTGASTFKNGGRIQSISTNVTGGSEAFDLVFNTLTGSVLLNERLRILSTGQLKFNAYTSSGSFGGTPVAALMTNSTGDVIAQEPVLQVTSLTINQATVNGAFTTPVTLVAAPGAGKVIVPSILIFKLNFAAAFATNTTYAFQIGSTTITTSKSFGQASSIYNIDPVNSLTSVAIANLANQPLQWKVQVGNSTGGLGSTISIGCIYTVMTI